MRLGEGGPGWFASPPGGLKPWLAFRIAFGNEGLFRGNVTNAGLACLRPDRPLALSCCTKQNTSAQASPEFFAMVRTIGETSKAMKWICCHLGAREHYAIPRALFSRGLLDCLITDAWVPVSSFLAK